MGTTKQPAVSKSFNLKTNRRVKENVYAMG